MWDRRGVPGAEELLEGAPEDIMIVGKNKTQARTPKIEKRQKGIADIRVSVKLNTIAKP